MKYACSAVKFELGGDLVSLLILICTRVSVLSKLLTVLF